MKLYFLRHGIAADRDEWQGSDFDRPLTSDGRKRMRAEAKGMRRIGIEVDAIVTSPLVRARETAAIVAEGLKAKDPVEDQRVGPSFSVDGLKELLHEHPDAQALMFVGHDPTMTQTIAQLAGGAKIDFKKGGLALVEVSGPSASGGTLLWLLPPKALID